MAAVPGSRDIAARCRHCFPLTFWFLSRVPPLPSLSVPPPEGGSPALHLTVLVALMADLAQPPPPTTHPTTPASFPQLWNYASETQSTSVLTNDCSRRVGFHVSASEIEAGGRTFASWKPRSGADRRLLRNTTSMFLILPSLQSLSLTGLTRCPEGPSPTPA